MLSFEDRGGRRWRFGASVCFDNAFAGPYTEPLRAGAGGAGLDFHLVVSNEAWYRESWEVDQMMAYSHVIAAATGRALVRATNSGISAVVAPDGSERARLRVSPPAGRSAGTSEGPSAGADRMVRGTLRASVPVPRERGAITPYVRLEWLWLAAALLAPWLVLALRPRSGGREEAREEQ